MKGHSVLVVIRIRIDKGDLNSRAIALISVCDKKNKIINKEIPF